MSNLMIIMLKKIYIVLFVLGSMAVMAFTVGIDANDIPKKTSIIEEANYEPVVVLELFTSQGCSSCPSADVLLQKVKKEYSEQVFALSYHVDYWNYIGWKDPFSKSIYAEKQREYNRKFRNRSNYTPQLVVNGKEHFVGSNSAKMYAKINAYKEKKTSNHIKVNEAYIKGSNVSFSYDIDGGLKNKIIKTLLVLDERTTQVKRGENRNRTLKNSNIVVAEKSFQLENKTGMISIPVPEIVTGSDKLNLIVLIENTDYDITAAAKQSLVR